MNEATTTGSSFELDPVSLEKHKTLTMWEAVDEAKRLVTQTRQLSKDMKEERLAIEEDFSQVLEKLNTVHAVFNDHIKVFNDHIKVIEGEKKSWREHNQKLEEVTQIFEDGNDALRTERIALRGMAAQYQKQKFRFHVAGMLGGGVVLGGVLILFVVSLFFPQVGRFVAWVGRLFGVG
jgi:hypothetical protein